jgi:hypothetical protein
MRRPLVAGAVALATLALPAAVLAGGDGKGAKSYRATLAANDAAATAGVPDARGRAQLVDNRKRDKVSLHMKGLEPGTTYLWHVHQATAEGDPCAAGSTVGNPAPYPGFTYRTLKAGPKGNANSKGTSRTFPVAAEDTGEAYYVNVHLEDGTVIACGVLERKRRASDDGERRGRSDESRGRGRGHDKD